MLRSVGITTWTRDLRRGRVALIRPQPSRCTDFRTTEVLVLEEERHVRAALDALGEPFASNAVALMTTNAGGVPPCTAVLTQRSSAT